MGSLFKSPKVVPPPPPAAPAPMPDPTSPAVLEARRKSTEMAMARAGRASTILSTRDTRADAGGTDTYSSTHLG